jgi:4-hydroxy-tetrahydrodipicolinate synthase
VNTGGVYSVLPTPFRAGGDVDHESLARVTDLAIRARVRGITVLGITGETARLTDRERTSAIETVVRQAAGRVTVVAGTSADGTRSCIEYSREARAIGAGAVLISPPRLPRFSSETIINHYRLVAEAVDLPIIVQDYPRGCGFTMESALLARIAREVPAARIIKLEDPPTPLKTTRILMAAGETRVCVLGGLGGEYLLEELMAGAAGVMTGFAYPEALVMIVNEFRAGRVDQAAEIFYRILPLMRFEFQEGIGVAIRKELYRRRGAIADASTRAPGAVLDESTRAALDRVLAWTKAQPGLGELMDGP